MITYNLVWKNGRSMEYLVYRAIARLSLHTAFINFYNTSKKYFINYMNVTF